jgi:sigma-B regulation protein RsbU (phosphoserine phosphatase)
MLQGLSTDLVRHSMPAVMLGACFTFIGVASCSISAIRHRAQSRVLVWFGLFIGMYGCRMLAQQAIDLHLAAASSWPVAVVTSVNYLLILPALLFWVELSCGPLARFFLSLFFFGSLSAILGLIFAAAGFPQFLLLRTNLVLTVGSMLTLGVILAFPRLTRGQLLLKTGILKFVVPVMALLAVGINLLWLIHVPPPAYFEPIAFMGWVFALGYEAASRTFANEHRLVVIQTELETARRMQASILPASVPDIPGLRITATYKPMSAVAGDFYQFLRMDEHRLGILVADVTGHGVPAALIASMIKVAAQSVAPVADDPSEVLSRLNTILTPELGGSLTSAAYLLVDADGLYARYSAAGHPPLLRWASCQSSLMRLESNGLIFGVNPSCHYPVREFGIATGDRLLMYTDGLIEPENASGEPFGDRELERVLRTHRSATGNSLPEEIFSALSAWQSAAKPQQDDITLLTIDVC